MPGTAPEPVNIARPGKRPYYTTMTPAERRDRAATASNTRWSRVTDTRAETRPVREARRASFYREADRLGITDPAARERMARSAMLAEMARIRRIKLRKERLAREAAGAAVREREAS